MDDIYKRFEEYNPNKEHKILIVFDDMIVDMLSNKFYQNSQVKFKTIGNRLSLCDYSNAYIPLEER